MVQEKKTSKFDLQNMQCYERPNKLPGLLVLGLLCLTFCELHAACVGKSYSEMHGNEKYFNPTLLLSCNQA